MKRIFLLLTIVAMASCSPQRRLARLLDKYPQPERIDTVYIPGETIYKDTTIYRTLPGETDTVEVYVDVPIDLPDTSILAETELALAQAFLENNILRLELQQKEAKLRLKLDNAIRESRDTLKITEEKVVTVTEYKEKPFYKNGFFILSGLIVVALLFYFLLRRE